MIDLVTSARTPYSVAKTLALRGLAVFPVRSRRPLTARGFYSATADIHALPQLNWADADGVGMPTGEVSGIDVLDVDVRGIRARIPEDRESPPHIYGGEGRDGFAALATLPPLPSTLSASTPRNGRHFYFHHVVGGRNRKLGDGSVEWFSTGKLVVVPPAPGRTWLNQARIAEAPDWFKALVTAPKPIHPHNGDHGGGSSGPQVNEADLQGQDDDRQVPRQIYLLILRGMPTAKSQTQRRVRGLWKNLAEKTDHRNDGLNYTAWQFRQFVEAGDLKVEVASKLLRLACEANGYIDKDGPDVIDEMIDRVLQREDVG
jgi:Bifunctional DNA primase/polymerase, N-terminal